MFKTQVFRQAARALARGNTSTAPRSVPSILSDSRAAHIRLLSATTTRRLPSDEDLDNASSSAPPGASGDHEGQFARTDDAMRFEQPEDKDMPPSRPVRGRGGEHSLPTLASFSLDKKVVVVTGGARGLGLVMGQGCIISGSDLAIVDLNSQ